MRLFLALLLFLSSNLGSAQNQKSVGSVISTSGIVQIQKPGGQLVLASRRGEIFEGDVLITDTDGFVQLRFIDSAILFLTCNSELRIVKYSYQMSEKDVAELHLINGGIRTIIGSIDFRNYRLVTEAAEVEARGTDFEFKGIDFETGRKNSGDWYFGVYNGGIKITNSNGFVNLGLDAKFHFARAKFSTTPEALINQPAQLGISIDGICSSSNPSPIN